MKLLENENSVSICQQNFPILATEMYKVNKNLSSTLMRDILKLRSEQINLRQISQLNPISL